jgi:hypothetical protein
MICWFMPCDWRYFGCVAIQKNEPGVFDSSAPYELAGLYQCSRCKTLSLGSQTDPARRAQPQSGDGNAPHG